MALKMYDARKHGEMKGKKIGQKLGRKIGRKEGIKKGKNLHTIMP